MSSTRDILRSKLLNEVYDKMSEEDKKMYALMLMENRQHSEIMDAIEAQNVHLRQMGEHLSKNTWKTNFITDLGANALWDGVLFLGRKLFK